MKPLTLVLLAWALWADIAVVRPDEAVWRDWDPLPSFGTFNECKTGMGEHLEKLASNGQGWIVQQNYALRVEQRWVYVVRYVCLPDSFTPRDWTRVG